MKAFSPSIARLMSCAVCLVAGLLTGCDEPAQTVAVEAPPPTKITTADYGDSIGKPTVPVTVDYSFAGEPKVGEPLAVRLSVRGSGVSGLSMSLATRGALSMVKTAPTQIALKSGLASNDAAEHEALVIAADRGRSYLNVQITGIYENQPFTKAISIPIQVGEGGPVLSTNGEIIDTGVEVLSVMPAEQTIESDSSAQQ